MTTTKKTKKAAPKKKGKPAPKVQEPAPFDVVAALEAMPPELHEIELSEDVFEAWKGLKPVHQNFFLKWISNGFNGAEAWEQTLGKFYDKPSEKPTAHLCSVMAHQTLAGARMKKLRLALGRNMKIPFERLYKVLADGMEAKLVVEGVETPIPDHRARLHALAIYQKFLPKYVEMIEPSEEGADGKKRIVKIGHGADLDFSAVQHLFPAATQKETT